MGITEPEDGEPVLSPQQEEMPPEGEGNDIMSSLFGGMPPPPNGGEADKQFREFAKDMKKQYGEKQ